MPLPSILARVSTIAGSIAVLALAPGASAQAQATEQQYVDQVLASGLAARQLESEAAVERAESAGAGAWPNPLLEWEREAGGAPAGVQDKVGASIPLVLSGRLGAEREAAEARARASDLRLQRARGLLRRRAVEAFWRARAAQERVRLLADSRRELSRVAGAVAVRERLGEAAGYDRLRIDLEAASVEALLGDAELERSRLEAEALALLGPGGGALPTLHGTLVPERKLPPVEVIVEQLEAQRADLRALALEAEAAERAGSAAARSWIPEPTVGGGALLQPETGTGYFLSASVPLPLFQHGQGARARASAQQRLADDRRALALHQAQAALSAAHAQALGTRAQLERHRSEVLRRARELRQVAAAAYQGGGELLVLVDGERAFREAQLRELELALSVVQAEADLLLLSGALDAAGPEGAPR